MRQPVPGQVKVMIGFHLVSVVLWFFGQTLAIWQYDLVASWGLQDARELLNPALVEVNRGIGLADTILLLPLHLLAAVGLWRMRFWGAVLTWIAFGITMYWPLVFWTSNHFFAQGGIQAVPANGATIGVTVFIFVFAIWGSQCLYRMNDRFVWGKW